MYKEIYFQAKVTWGNNGKSYWISVKFNKLTVWISKYLWMWIILSTRTTGTGYTRIILTWEKIKLIWHVFVDPNTRSNNKHPSSRCRSQWRRSIRNEPSSTVRTLKSSLRIPLKAWMSVCVYSVFVLFCVGSGLATGWSAIKGPINCVHV
jgi:hypothetical protein